MSQLKFLFTDNLFFRAKKQQLLFLLLALPFFCKAQENVIHTGEYISIPAGVNLYILGSYKDTSTSPSGYVVNQGIMNVKGDLINKGTQNIFGTTPPPSGTLRFFGSPASNSQIFSAKAISLKNLIIDLGQPALTGNVLLRSDSVNVYGNVSFLNGGFDLGVHTLNLIRVDTSHGIIAESNTARALLLTDNPLGKISVKNFPFQSNQTYSNIKGIGVGFTLMDPLGGNPILSRTFHAQGCGDSTAHTGSILRVFRMQGNAYAAKYNNVTIGFLNATELGGNSSGNALHVFVSERQGQVWNQNLHNTGAANSVSSTDVNTFTKDSTGQVFSVITGATNPCGNLAPIHINQIITTVTPQDTLFSIDSVVSCNPSSVFARLYASGDYGATFGWKAPGSNVYVTQNGPGYFDATALGVYWIRMSTIRGCMDSISIKVVPVSPGNASITAQPNICLGTSITMHPVAAHDPTATYKWDFGDGYTPTSYNATHTFASSGNKIISLTVKTAQGCLSSSADTVMVNSIPQASFNASSACPGTPITFHNTSTVASLPTTVSLSWSFGDGTTGATTDNTTGTSPSGTIVHTYVATGIDTVKLIATANGCSSLPYAVPITVYPVPVTLFTYGAACEGQAVTFSNTSSISDASPLSYLWDFTGTGPTSASVNPVYTYTTNGTYNVSLTTTSTNGCTSTLTHQITIGQNPVVSFNLTNACVNIPASFGSTTAGTPLTYLWNFGDSNTGSLQNESHSYSIAGSYNVALTVTTSSGCTASTTQSITIYPGPNVSFTAQNQCVNTSVSFTNTSTNATSYLWDFPSLSTTSSMQNPVETFSNAGRFPVKLTATSSNGCQATRIDSVTVYPLPIVNLGAAVKTCGNSYTLDANNSGSTFMWTTGSTTQQYVVTHNGTYGVTVTNSQGCSASQSVSVTLNSVVSPTLGSNSSYCDSTTLDAGYPGATYAWSTGASTQTIQVTTTGTYSVTVTDQNNCSGSSSVSITINKGTPVSLGPDKVACASTGVLLNAGVASSYLWNTGATTSTLQVPATGYYWVRISNGAGCSSSDTIHVTLNPSPVFSLGNDTAVCNQYVLNAFVSNSTYSWNTGVTTPSITVSNSGSYKVIVTDNTTHCSSADSIKLIINPLPAVNLGSDITLCSYQTATLNAGNPGSAFQWNNGQTTQTIAVSTQGLYSVKVTDANHCVNTGQITVNVRPLFAINLGPDRPYCTGSTLILDPGLTTTGNSYEWSNQQGVLSTSSTYTVADTGKINLTVKDTYQCVAMDSINILPSTLSLFPEFLADSKIKNGESDVMVNLSYPKPYTSEWFIGNVSVSTDSSPTLLMSIGNLPLRDSTVFVTLKVNNQFCLSQKTKPILVLSGHRPISPAPKAQDPNLFSEIYSVNLYPNPNNGFFNFYIDINLETFASIKIYSITGALIYSEEKPLATGTTSYDFENLSTGIYFFQVTTRNDRRTLKFIKTAN
jgi:PKD repeat protein